MMSSLILLIALVLPSVDCFARGGVSGREPVLTRLEANKFVIVGAGFGGWGAAKAIVESGNEAVLIDSIPDPTGATPFLTPTGKPFEPGTKGFWKDYPNIYEMLKNLGVNQDDIFTPCTNSSFFSPYGLEATAPVFGDSIELPSPLGQVFASAKLFKRLPLKDRASMVGLLVAMLDFDRDEETLRKYDRMSAHELFIRFKLSKRLVDDFIRPTLLVGLFKPPEELSAAVTMELLYFYALAHQTSFDVKWMKRKSISELVINPLAVDLQKRFPGKLQVIGGSRVTRLNLKNDDADAGSEEPSIDSVEYTSADGSLAVIDNVDGCVLALGAKGMKSVIGNSPAISKRSVELSKAAALGGIDCIAVRLWLDTHVSTETPANVFSRFEELRGAGGTFFMLDQLQGPAYGGSAETVRELWAEEEPQGSVVACDFYNAGALLGLSDEDVVATLLDDTRKQGLLTKAVPGFKDAKIVDSYVYRAPGAVSWFSPGSYSSRPPLVVPGFRNSLVCAGDWVRMGQKETRAKGLCQERAFICGLEAGNALLDKLQDGGRRHPVLPIREDEPQVVLGRAANRQLQELLKPLGLDSFWVR